MDLNTTKSDLKKVYSPETSVSDLYSLPGDYCDYSHRIYNLIFFYILDANFT